MRKEFKNTKGITLIALVITIIILLILAAVTLGALAGNDGLFGKTKDAEKKWNLAQEKENNTLDEYAKEIDKYLEEVPNFTNVNISETNPVGATPSGVTVVEADANKGIVIKDKNNNEWTWVIVPKSIYTNTEYNEGTAPESSEDYIKIESILKNYTSAYKKSGEDDYYIDEWYDLLGVPCTGENEYVEVGELPSENDFNYARTLVGNLYIKISDRYELAENYTENTVYFYKNGVSTVGCGLTYVEYKKNYENMLKSVYTNGGFWISRYEAGVSESDTIEATARTKNDREDISKKAVSQKNMILYDYVTCSEAQTLAKQMNTDNSKTTSLLFGIQWDLVCKYLEVYSTLVEADINLNSRRWGHWEDGIFLKTGISNETSVLNISDFAGNAGEWTLEHRSESSAVGCTFRGYSLGRASSRSQELCYHSEEGKDFVGSRRGLSFRTTIYNQ